MKNPEKSKLPRIDSKSEDERICAILIPEKSYEVDEDEYVELPEATPEMLTKYYNFLLNKLPPNIKMTGREDLGYFGWEERFSFMEDGDEEYEALKQKFASCDDKFEFIQLDSISDEFGIVAEVKRISDQKIFMIPLVDLDVCKRKTPERQLVDDYSSWFVNFGPEAM